VAEAGAVEFAGDPPGLPRTNQKPPIQILSEREVESTSLQSSKLQLSSCVRAQLQAMEDQNTVGPIFKWQPDEDNPKANNKIILTHVAFKGFP
jgi:hypothetical protein